MVEWVEIWWLRGRVVVPIHFRRWFEDVKIVEYKKWTGKEGLGFQGEAPEKVSSKKDGKNGEDVRVESDHGRREGKEGKEGKEVDRRDGRRDRDSRERRGDRREDVPSSRRSTRDSRNEEVRDNNSRDRRDNTMEHVPSSRRSTRDIRDEEVRGSRDVEVNDSRKKERKHRGGEDVEKHLKDERRRGHQELRKSDRVIWVRNHIRVRVISEAVKGGRFYLKKGEVVDVVGSTCDILMDGSRELIQGVKQEYLETALPKRGGPVLVLNGKHKGVYGSLVEKDAEKETGVVQDADNHEMFNVPLEQIAEFIGDPSYIGY